MSFARAALSPRRFAALTRSNSDCRPYLEVDAVGATSSPSLASISSSSSLSSSGARKGLSLESSSLVSAVSARLSRAFRRSDRRRGWPSFCEDSTLSSSSSRSGEAPRPCPGPSSCPRTASSSSSPPRRSSSESSTSSPRRIMRMRSLHSPGSRSTSWNQASSHSPFSRTSHTKRPFSPSVRALAMSTGVPWSLLSLSSHPSARVAVFSSPSCSSVFAASPVSVSSSMTVAAVASAAATCSGRRCSTSRNMRSAP
mmetsp:Transcript_14003/g.38288  ORF Transcript_14003/g.38288 Transcript_14003/m.38288 type:complete len:255 (-) Transcript_14003:42-806(-)